MLCRKAAVGAASPGHCSLQPLLPLEGQGVDPPPWGPSLLYQLSLSPSLLGPGDANSCSSPGQTPIPPMNTPVISMEWKMFVLPWLGAALTPKAGIHKPPTSHHWSSKEDPLAVSPSPEQQQSLYFRSQTGCFTQLPFSQRMKPSTDAPVPAPAVPTLPCTPFHVIFITPLKI